MTSGVGKVIILPRGGSIGRVVGEEREVLSRIREKPQPRIRVTPGSPRGDEGLLTFGGMLTFS